ncbi:MAG TPA: hypothetical protein VMZ29_05375 [Candidatus Bathyarchaeia archaeon]|nr:hypothetical protein [Candidatus Bathyarchaeia archaeon]
MSEEKNETKAEVIEKEEETEEISETEKIKLKNIAKIEILIKELDKIDRKKDPNIRICPRCFSLRIKMEDVIAKMGMGTGYPTCYCMDCGWRSKVWLYLDRTLSEEEREGFLKEIVKEKTKK